MYSDHYETIGNPESVEKFTDAMQGLCGLAGADKFIVLLLTGEAQSEIVRVFHRGPASDPEHFRPLAGMATALVRSGLPVHIKPGMVSGVLDGLMYGAAAFCRNTRHGCIVIFGRQSEFTPAEVFELQGQVQLAAAYATPGLEPLLPQKPCPLRPRELECLAYYWAGKSSKETARLLGIGPRTVEGHLERARARCGVSTTLAACKVAHTECWLDLGLVQKVRDAA